MKRMQATITLKRLRTDPRYYIELLNRNYEVTITDHSRVLAVTERKSPKKGNAKAVVEAVKNLPPLDKPVPDQDLSYKEMMLKYRGQDYEKLSRQLDGRAKDKK